MAPQEGEPRLRVHEDYEEPIPPEGKQCVGINGYWYDVTHFIPKHPGGPIIERFVGKDATTVFNAFRHSEDLLKHRKPVGAYKIPVRHPADQDFEELVAKFEKLGYYKTDWSFYVKKLTFVYSLLAIAFYSVINLHHLWYMRIVGGAALAFFWQQSGFVMHELMHSQVFRTNRTFDRLFGTLIGTIGFGMSAHWWQDEHILHHGMTNTVDLVRQLVDPQMWEAVWAQNKKMFPLFGGILQYCLIRIQHITFVPVVIICGRVEILLDSYWWERRWYEWCAIAAHWAWMIYLLSWLPTWSYVFQVYAVACMVEGVFHFQLILSHYCKAFLEVDDFHKSSWYVFQVASNMNIDTYWWLDWYYGGLNFHIEHHLFPKMARRNLRRVAPYVEAICKKHDIEYDNNSFMCCLGKTLEHLKKTGKLFKLDPR